MTAPDLTSQILQTLRRQGGVSTSVEFQAALGVRQPTVSRALAQLIRKGQVQKVGAARSQRYVLPRHVPGVGAQVPVMRIDALGQASPFAHMVPLHGGAGQVFTGGRFTRRPADPRPAGV
jgi:DNA-binding IclR family transcriptional regulator